MMEEHFHSDSDVPRSPGPLDGSMYTQVMKSKRGGAEEAPEEIEGDKFKRLCHSADELSEAPTSQMQATVVRKRFSDTDSEDSVTDPIATSLCSENNQSVNSFPATSQLHGSVEPGGTPGAWSTVAPHDKNEHVGSATTCGAVTSVVETSFEKSASVPQTDTQTKPTVGDHTNSDVRAGSTSHHEIAEDRVAVEQDTLTMASNVADGAAGDAAAVLCETPTQGLAANSAETDNDMSVRAVRVVVVPELRVDPASNLTQKQVHEAMALVNECLADHEARSVASEHSSHDILDEPNFPTPQDPDYPELEPDPSRFADKGPEYALPVRDVILGSVPARKALLVTSPTEFPSIEQQIDEAVSQLMVSEGPSQDTTSSAIRDNALPSRTAGFVYEDSIDAKHSAEIALAAVTNASVVTTMTYSDADSGIVVSSSYDVKPSPTLDRSKVDNAPPGDYATDYAKSYEVAGSRADDSATPFPERVVHYVPAPKPAEIQVITVRNVYTDFSEAGQYSLQQQSSPSAQTVVTEKSDSALNVGGRKRSLPPGEAISARRSGPIPYRIEQSPKRVEVQPQHSYEAPRREPPPDFLDALAKDETEEERRVREEIENTQRKLLWLQEQQNKIKKKKNDQQKRHSYGYTPSSEFVGKESAPTHVISATLPRRPAHHVTEDNQSESCVSSGITTKERHDMDALLRSVQDLDFSPAESDDKYRDKKAGDMATSTLSRDQSQRYPHFHETSPGFAVPDAGAAQRAAVFTPAYAHPMHQPKQMERHRTNVDPTPVQKQQSDWQQKKKIENLQEQERMLQEERLQQQRRQLEWQEQQNRNEELQRKRNAELRQQQQQEREEREEQQKRQEEYLKQQRRQEEWRRQQLQEAEQRRRQRLEEERDILRRQMEQERLLQLRREREYKEQEERRAKERELQQKFEREFEHKQKQLRKDRPPQREEPLITGSALQQQKAKLTQPKSPPPSAAPPQPQLKTATDRKAELTEDLQHQLDELDRYIAQLSNVSRDPAPAPSPSKPEVSLRRRRSFSVELDLRRNPSTDLTEEDSAISTATVQPPRPPSRTRSSFESVSRRLSHGFELAQAMRQTSVDGDSKTTKDEDVFSPGATAPQPSYPPKSSLTRPPQQQIVSRPLATPQQVSPSQAQTKAVSLEEQLSPQLFLAMTVNPGARPVENIHSYKEDLQPENPSSDDAVTPLTPGFPILPGSPTTPYFNVSGTQGQHPHVPVGLAKTPLSELGLKPKEHPEEAAEDNPMDVEQKVRSHLDSAPKQTPVSTTQIPSVVANGYGQSITNSSRLMPKETNLLSGNLRLEEQERPRGNHTFQSVDPSTNENIHGLNAEPGIHQTTTGISAPYPNRQQAPSMSNGSVKMHALSNGGSSPLVASPDFRSPGLPPFGSSLTPPASGSGGVSPSGTRSLTGSNDSLLSDGSASHSRFGNPPLPPKESSRLSGSSVRSSSTAGSGYLGGTSQTSPHSAGSPISGTAPYTFSHAVGKRESQLSAYDRQVFPGHHGMSSGDEGSLNSPISGRTSSSSVSDVEKLAQEFAHSGLSGGSPPKFIRDTTSYWYKPDITREQAHAMLRNRPPGSFVVRDSRCYPGAFGLALKVNEVPPAVLATVKPGTDINNELVRHFLIEPSSRGVKLKGCANEPVFGSLSALIYQHSITPLALPCKLIIPNENMEVRSRPGSVQSSQEISNSAADLLRQGAACNVLYIGSADTESLTGPEAIERAMREVTQVDGQAIKTSIVHFKVSPQGITLTDNARKIFFRRHYPTASLTFCGMDPSSREPHNRRWDASGSKGPRDARVFGFVAKKQGGVAENSCHLFAELDLEQPASAIVNFVTKILMASHN